MAVVLEITEQAEMELLQLLPPIPSAAPAVQELPIQLPIKVARVQEQLLPQAVFRVWPGMLPAVALPAVHPILQPNQELAAEQDRWCLYIRLLHVRHLVQQRA